MFTIHVLCWQMPRTTSLTQNDLAPLTSYAAGPHIRPDTGMSFFEGGNVNFAMESHFKSRHIHRPRLPSSPVAQLLRTLLTMAGIEFISAWSAALGLFLDVPQLPPG